MQNISHPQKESITYYPLASALLKLLIFVHIFYTCINNYQKQTRTFYYFIMSRIRAKTNFQHYAFEAKISGVFFINLCIFFNGISHFFLIILLLFINYKYSNSVRP
jgi:hypothetical protein